MTPVIVGVAALAVGVVVGFLVRANMAKSSANTLEAQARQQVIAAEQKVLEANQEAATVLRKANEDAKADARPSDPKGDAASWKKRRQDLDAALERARLFADSLQSRINGLTADFSARDDPAQRSIVSADRQRALTELDRVKKEIQQHTKALADLQEEARKSGVPPGWLR